ncbi:cilia- and flagella-associated 36 isoform X1 [Pelobates cultripes]|uniref:Cilia- and flagella-associated protein 36 n=1 Tax=Pelobates cultripes TaxID=61616 RepID=A0AAD1RH51_PELCU|nr:cilia- and flagella-associated 36 isoform X1 [Pelobates cultripes]
MAEDAEWVLESLLGFLGGPAWTAAVTEFVEQRCSVFDDDEENKLSFTEIHHEYKELVEKLLECHLNEVGINEDQFQQACASPLTRSPEVQTFLQPVYAVEDFTVFKAMMVQKNIELQLQAIKIIQERNGVLPDCLQDGADVISDLEEQENKLITEALRISKEEYEKEQLRRATKNTDTRCPVEVSSSSVEVSKPEIPISRTESINHTGEAIRTHKAKQPPLEVQKHSMELPSIKLKGVSNKEAAEEWLAQARKETGIQSSNTSLSQGEKEQLQKRAEYLKQKRDQLLGKKLDLKKTVNSSKEEATTSTRELTEDEIKNLEKRKRLAEKLKEEVINK